MGAPVAEGQILAGKYRVEQILGRGGMGVVVAAMHEQLQQRVAIKFLLPGASHEATQRFLREARAAVRLKSEHVARVTDVGELEGGAPYMVMEYLDGTDLSHLVRQRGALPVEEAITYVLHACEAIAEAHAAGIVHRDLKPANLFLTTAADGSQTVKVLDFGISKTPLADTAPGAEPAVGLTQTEMMLGSPLYMAPEQMRSAKSVDRRADIWSMGALSYQLLTGVVPFNTTSLAELILMISTQEPPPLRAHRADLPAELEAAVLRCLRKPVEERYQNVAEYAQAIAPFAPVEEVARSLPRILRTMGLTSTSPMAISRSASSIGSGAYPAVSAAAASVAAAATQPSAAPSGAAGPHAETLPKAGTATGLQGPTLPSARTAPGASETPSIPPPAALPSIAPAVARTAQSGGEADGTSNPPEPTPNAATAAGWTAQGDARPARSSAAGKVIAALVALLTVGGGAGLAVVKLREAPAEVPTTAAAQAEVAPTAAPEPKAEPKADIDVAPAALPTPEPDPMATGTAEPTAIAPAPTATANAPAPAKAPRPTPAAPSAPAAKPAAAAAPASTPAAPSTAPTIDDPLKKLQLH